MTTRNQNRDPLRRCSVRMAGALLALILAATAAAGTGPKTRIADAPRFADLPGDDVIRALLAPEERSAVVGKLAARVRDARRTARSVVVLRLEDVTLTADRLPWRERRALQGLAGREMFDIVYERAMNDLFVDVIRAARGADGGPISVYGLPVEADRRSHAEARLVNARYDETLRETDVFVTSRTFIISGGGNAAPNLRRAIPQAMESVFGRPVLFQQNGTWRVATAPARPALPAGPLEGNAPPTSPDPVQSVLDAWGSTDSPWDLNADGIVDTDDLMMVLAHPELYTDNGFGGVGRFVDLPATYTIESGLDLAFETGATAPPNPNVIFQVWSMQTGSIEAPYPDYDAPFAYPAAALDEVTPGDAIVQAIVRDASNTPVITIEAPLLFAAADGSGVVPGAVAGGSGGDSGGDPPGGDDPNGGTPDDPPPGDPPPGDPPDDPPGGGDGQPPWGDPDAPAPAPVITVLDTEGEAPFTAHVHALGSNLGTGDRLTAYHVWNFGDPGGDYDEILGWNAAHVYELPGTYTVTLAIVNDAGRLADATAEIVVHPSSRDAIYIAANGSDANTGGSPSSPLRTYGRALELLDDDTAVYFRRGDIFDIDDGVGITSENVLFGAYGNGAKPKIRWTGSKGTSALLAMTPDHCRDIVVQDIHFTSIYGDSPERNLVTAIKPAGQNVTVRRCKFTHVTEALNCEREPTGVLSYDNKAPIHNGLRAYYCWVQGTDHTHIGNFVNGSMHEHCIRLGGAERVNLSLNDLTNQEKTTIWAMVAKNVYISRNHLSDAPIVLGPNPYGGSDANRLKWCVVEGNLCDKLTPNAPALQTKHGAKHLMIRNNVFRTDGDPAIYVMGYSPDHDRTTSDMRILGNTAVNLGEGGSFAKVESGAEDLAVMNNLFVAPDFETGNSQNAILYVEGEDLSAFTAICNNVWPVPSAFHWVGDGYHYVWPYWSNAEGYRNVEEWEGLDLPVAEMYQNVEIDESFRPLPGGECAGHAVRVPGVFTDFHGNIRPNDGIWTAGAAEVE